MVSWGYLGFDLEGLLSVLFLFFFAGGPAQGVPWMIPERAVTGCAVGLGCPTGRPLNFPWGGAFERTPCSPGRSPCGDFPR